MTAGKEATGYEQSGLNIVREVAKHSVRAMRKFAAKTAKLAPAIEASCRNPGGTLSEPSILVLCLHCEPNTWHDSRLSHLTSLTEGSMQVVA